VTTSASSSCRGFPAKAFGDTVYFPKAKYLLSECVKLTKALRLEQIQKDFKFTGAERLRLLEKHLANHNGVKQ